MSIKSKRNYSLSFNGLFKRLFHLFAVGFFATAMLLSSCSLFDSENGGKVVVRIDGQMAEQNLSDVQDQTVFRAGSGPDAGVLNGLFMDITINGGYSETKTVSLNSETQTQVTFFDIPIGISVYITASAYAMKNGDKTVYYEGTSEIFTIKSGTNEVSLTMQRKKTEPVKPEEPEEPEEPEKPEEPDPASVELNISIKATSTSDVTVRNVREGKVVTFTAEEGWTTYTWKIDGKVQTTTGNILKVDTTDWGKGSYDITLIVTKSDANDLYSAQVTIE